MVETKIVNFFGASGVGKSTLAAELFSYMKKQKYSVELNVEFAKELVWSGRQKELANQYYVFGEQLNRILNVYGQVEYIITDSPILLGTIYNDPNRLTASKYLSPLLEDVFFQFDTVNFLVESDYKTYDLKGRNQDAEESKQIAAAIKQYLNDLNISYRLVNRETEITQIYDNTVINLV